MALKLSANQYRNIKGTHFICWCFNSNEFAAEKAKCRALGLKTRIIDGQLYIEKKEGVLPE